MKFSRFTLVVLCIFTSFCVFMASAFDELEEKNTAELAVKITRVKNISGQLYYQLFVCPKNAQITWQELIAVQSGNVEIKQTDLMLNFTQLPHSAYIVRVFQDTNNNAQLDYASNGVPKEPTGFSNNPNLMLGLPNPFDSCFNYQAGAEVEIKLNNKRSRKKRKI